MSNAERGHEDRSDSLARFASAPIPPIYEEGQLASFLALHSVKANFEEVLGEAGGSLAYGTETDLYGKFFEASIGESFKSISFLGNIIILGGDAPLMKPLGKSIRIASRYQTRAGIFDYAYNIGLPLYESGGLRPVHLDFNGRQLFDEKFALQRKQDEDRDLVQTAWTLQDAASELALLSKS